jgi:thioredoxin-like negative regulator of GroEL
VIELLLQAERALANGLVDHAERIYWQAVEADPRNSIAIVGLARVAIEREDDRGAYVLGLRALAVDAENQAARRLVDRLAEVMAHRGESLPDPPEGPLVAPARQVGDRPAAAALDPSPDPSPPPGASPPSPSRRPGLFRRLLRRDG